MNYPPNISPDRYEPDNSWTKARNRGRRGFGHPRTDEPHNYHHNSDNDYVQILVPTSGRMEIWTKGNNNSNSCRPDTSICIFTTLAAVILCRTMTAVVGCAPVSFGPTGVDGLTSTLGLTLMPTVQPGTIGSIIALPSCPVGPAVLTTVGTITTPADLGFL